MSDRKKPDLGPTAGRSGRAGDIGAELGGDLDFEPDDLLDSLLVDDDELPTRAERVAPPPTPAPPAPSPHPTSAAEHEEHLVVPLDLLDDAPLAAYEPSLDDVGSSPAPGDEPIIDDELTLDDVAEAPLVGASRGPSGLPLPSEPPPFPPPSAEDAARLTAEAGTVALDHAAPLDEPTPAPALAAARPDSAPPSTAVAASEDDDDLEVPTVLGGAREVQAAPPRRAPLAPSSFGDERPAASHLTEQAALQAWRQRAEWFAHDATRQAEPTAKGRALLVASELFAMLGDTARARALAADALRADADNALAERQVRQLAAVEGDTRAVQLALEQEVHRALTADARAHAALVAAQLDRAGRRDDAVYQRKLEAASRAQPTDVRAPLLRYAAGLELPKAPAVRWPEADGVAPLAEAASELLGLAGREALTPERSALSRLEAARRALDARDRVAAGRHLAQLGDELGPAARWLGAALLAVARESRPEAQRLLQQELAGDAGALARRTLAARALELGDVEAIDEAASEQSGLGPAERAALALLSGAAKGVLEPLLPELAAEPNTAALAATAAALVAAPGAPPAHLSGSPAERSAIRLGWLLAAEPERRDQEALEAASRALAEADDAEQARVTLLDLDHALTRGDAAAVGAIAMRWPGEGGTSAERALIAAFAQDLARDPAAAHEAFELALGADERLEVAARRLMVGAPESRVRELLELLAGATPDSAARALLLTEAALRQADPESPAARELTEQALAADPSLPLAWSLSELAARRRGDVASLIDVLEQRRATSEDALERALDGVRLAWLLADSAPARAQELLMEACEAQPTSVALRELAERMGAFSAAERASFRERLAQAVATPEERAQLALTAALDYQRAGDASAASRAAELAAREGSPLARLIADRAALASDAAPLLAERLLAEARALTDVVAQRELYEQLAELDEARGDAASARLWYTAILKQDPKYLPAARRLEHESISLDHQDQLEALALHLMELPDAGEATAHAWLALRLQSLHRGWAETQELCQRAAGLAPGRLWALRRALAHARAAGDDLRIMALSQTLLERSPHPSDRATLALRAGEAAARAGQLEPARALLAQALESVPEHLVALTTSAELLGKLGQPAEAAEALERAAQVSAVPAHRFAAWLGAALLWLDEAHDTARGRRALESALELDVTDAAAFSRLRDLYVAEGDRAALAELLERRLAATTDPEERVSLEVLRGRALAEVGERAEARAALLAALDGSPDHVEALTAFADLCMSEEDWPGAEGALLRLARHLAQRDRQLQVYESLAALYDGPLAQPDRAERAYLEVLERRPGDVAVRQRLIAVYGRLGQAARAEALAQELLEQAEGPEDKTTHTIGLAQVLDQVVGDRRRAEGLLVDARKQAPADARLLRALAEHYQRGDETAPLNMTLDRAVNDARRALSTGRFDPSFFELIATAAELRGHQDTAEVARATIAALAGEILELPGAGLAAVQPSLDELLAPPPFSAPFRALLQRTGDALERAHPVDLRALRAAPLPEDRAAIATLAEQIAPAFGLSGIQVLTAPSLGPTILAVGGEAPSLIIGKALLDSPVHPARYFLMLRAFKLLQSKAAIFARTAPIDLAPLTAAWLGTFASNWQPQGVDARKIDEEKQRLLPWLAPLNQGDVPLLALELTGTIGNRASQLATASHQWAGRTALLAMGELDSAFAGLALASGLKDGPPPDDAERLKWLSRHPEARDLAIFSVSEDYAEARRRAGL